MRRIRYVYYNRNPHNINEEDCVCRAISTAMDMDYYDVADLLALNGESQSCDMLTKSCYRRVLERKFGLKSHYGNGKTVNEVARMYPYNRVIMRVYAHLTCSLYGKVYDTFDCTDEMVDEYWIVC